MKFKILTILFSLSILNLATYAKVKVENISYSKEKKFGVVTVKYSGTMTDTPELTIKKNIVQIALTNSVVWPKVEKQISINKKFDSKLLAYQYNKDVVRVRAQLPYSLNGKENNVSVMLEDNLIKFYFPLEKSIVKKVSNAFRKASNKNKYDESYLDKLLNDKTVSKKNKIKKRTNSFLDSSDKVNTTLSSVKKKKGFDISSYVFKFIGFFSIMVGGLYLVLNFFRKGVLKKGGVGFLSGSKAVEVVNTTYLGPKRSLLMVRVNKQVFLLSQSEKGMDFLTEIEDTTSLLKESEKEVVGTNFDVNLDTANGLDKEFKLKDMTATINNNAKVEATEAELLKSLTSKKKKTSLSNQIKNKIKDLKPLQ